MEFRIVCKNEVMDMLASEDLYVIKIGHRNNTKYCSSKQAASLTLREVIDAISNPNIAFIEIKES